MSRFLLLRGSSPLVSVPVSRGSPTPFISVHRCPPPPPPPSQAQETEETEKTVSDMEVTENMEDAAENMVRGEAVGGNENTRRRYQPPVRAGAPAGGQQMLGHVAGAVSKRRRALWGRRGGRHSSGFIGRLVMLCPRRWWQLLGRR